MMGAHSDKKSNNEFDFMIAGDMVLKTGLRRYCIWNKWLQNFLLTKIPPEWFGEKCLRTEEGQNLLAPEDENACDEQEVWNANHVCDCGV